jgi:DNA-binding beta-propeller fold protein YncE
MRIAFASRGRLLVSDYQLGMILTVKRRSLKVMRGFRIEGKPLAVAAGKRVIYVGNDSTKRVEVYSRKGKWRHDLGPPGDLVLQPTDIAVDRRNRRVFVVDGRKKVVRVFGTDGAALYDIPSAYPDPQLLANPTGIALDKERGEILVSDYGDSLAGIPARIQIFSASGSRPDTISGRAGMLGSRFSRPQGLAVTREGQVLVADSLSGELLAFDRETGTHLNTVGSFGSAPGQLQMPLDLVIHRKSRDVFVINNRAGRIEVFRAGGTIP